MEPQRLCEFLQAGHPQVDSPGLDLGQVRLWQIDEGCQLPLTKAALNASALQKLSDVS